jgi:hypothetical protein
VSEESSERASEEIDVAEAKRQFAKEQDRQDFEFVSLVHMATSGLEISVTVAIEGAILSGMLIGAAEFFKLYGAAWRSGLGNADKAEEIEATFVTQGQEAKEQIESGKANLAFFHLRDAKIVSGGMVLPRQAGLLFRGRISRVSGFAVGKLSM